MRLVDADKVIVGLKGVKVVDDADKQSVRFAILEFESAPTVEAVPMSVIEDIKAEIEEVRKNALGYPNWEYAKGLETAWNIIDRHINGKGLV